MMRTLYFFLLFGSCSLALMATPPKREMRAAWIATVNNIDFPSAQAMTSEAQQAELCAILDTLEANNMNAVIFQIRPTADAFFCSTLEPWSHWLTAIQADMPHPFYDPLQFLIHEAHKRCIDVHVWLNPYRVTQTKDTTYLVPEHIFHRERDLFVQYGGRWYFDPGYNRTREWLNQVVGDLVQRYDIDAVHFDDYFYPYKVNGRDFPDERSFALHPRGFTPDQKDAWRRNNVNMIIAELQQTIKSIKPWVEFGISPFGVWRNQSVDPRGSDTRAGVQNYDDLYADILKWLEEGTIDYVMPQLYWEVGHSAADYEVLAQWWSDNSYGKNLYIGLYASRLSLVGASEPWQRPNELMRQLRVNKRHKPIDGVGYFSSQALMRNVQGINDSLQVDFYEYPALTPINRNIKGHKSAPPQRVRVLNDKENPLLIWDECDARGGDATDYYIVYVYRGKSVGDMSDPRHIVCRTTRNYMDLTRFRKDLKGHYTFVVTSVNRYKHESTPTYGVAIKL